MWAFLFSVLFSPFTYAATPMSVQATPTGYFEGPVATALGGTGRAAVSVTEGARLNPATLAHIDGYNIGFIYAAESLGERAGANKYHLVVSDSGEEAMFPGALSYSKISMFQQGRDVDLQELSASLGWSFSEYLSWGLTGKYLIQEVKGGAKANDFNGSTGFLFTPRGDLGFAITFDDFLETREIPANPTTGLGANYIFGRTLMIRGDVAHPQKSNPERRLISMLGIETMALGNDFKLRFGHRWDDFMSRRMAAIGFGWQGPKLGVNYAYEKNLQTEDFRHLIDMLLRF